MFDIATRRARVVVADVPIGANVDDYMGVWINFWNSAFSYSTQSCLSCCVPRESSWVIHAYRRLSGAAEVLVVYTQAQASGDVAKHAGA